MYLCESGKIFFIILKSYFVLLSAAISPSALGLRAHVLYKSVLQESQTSLGGSFTFTFMHLADTFIQNDLQSIQVIHFLSVCVFHGNRTHNLCAANAMF